MTNRAPVRFLDLQAVTVGLRPELDAAYRRVMDSGRYVLGEEVARFEQAFADAVGCRHAIGVGNGLDALCLALAAVGVGPGDEVVVPAHTFIATWHAVAMLGAVPIAAEPAPGGFNVDAGQVEPLLGARTRAIVAVHLYGEPVEFEPLAALCERRGLALIEDAAQAHGARRLGRPAGSLGRAAAFSFYPGKNLGAYGDAGAVTTSDDALAERVRRLRNYGALGKYDHDTEGRNSRLDPLQAALLGVKLPLLEAWNARRRELAALYEAGLAGLEGLELPHSLAGNDAAWHLYVIRCDRRDALAAHLAAAGIETQVHYPRAVCRCAPYAAAAPACATPSDRLASTVLSLPMGPHLDDGQGRRVVDTVRSFFG